MKLLLSSMSAGLSLLAAKLPKNGKGVKVLFSENAADPIPGDHFWVKNDRKAFEKMGSKVMEIDLRKLSKSTLAKLLREAGVIHFCGGSVAYLTSLLQKKGFDKLIAGTVRDGKLIYTGTSAGSIIAADNLKLMTFDPDEKEFVKQMKSSAGLGLVNFLLMPHANQPDFNKYIRSIVAMLPKHPEPLVVINDKQAVWVEDGKFIVLSV